MTDQTAPADFADAVEAVLQEYERHCTWLADLEDELGLARRRRETLAASVDNLLAALGPGAARAYAERLAAAAGPDARRRAGRPAPDGRHTALLALLADWPQEKITTAEATIRLRALGHAVPVRYAANSLRALAHSGALAPLGNGAYRIVRTHAGIIVARLGRMHDDPARPE